MDIGVFFASSSLVGDSGMRGITLGPLGQEELVGDNISGADFIGEDGNSTSFTGSTTAGCGGGLFCSFTGASLARAAALAAFSAAAILPLFRTSAISTIFLDLAGLVCLGGEAGESSFGEAGDSSVIMMGLAGGACGFVSGVGLAGVSEIGAFFSVSLGLVAGLIFPGTLMGDIRSSGRATAFFRIPLFCISTASSFPSKSLLSPADFSRCLREV